MTTGQNRVQIFRGNQAFVNSTIARLGELMVNTTDQEIRIGDGVTPGGHKLLDQVANDLLYLNLSDTTAYGRSVVNAADAEANRVLLELSLPLLHVDFNLTSGAPVYITGSAVVDTDSGWSGSTYTVPTTGFYLITAVFHATPSATFLTVINTWELHLNDVLIPNSRQSFDGGVGNLAAGSGAITRLISLTASDTIRAFFAAGNRVAAVQSYMSIVGLRS